MKARPVNVLVCAFWLLAIGAAFVSLGYYQNTGGQTGLIPARWPADTEVALDSQRQTLLFFAHPACPCTRASVEELNRTLAKAGKPLSVHAFLFSPSPLPPGWREGMLRSSLTAIPGVVIHDDVNGQQARRFGAETSGQVLLYNPAGQLLFHGGITGSRGHAGDNPASAALLASLNSPPSGARQKPVFGCSLTNPSSSPTPEFAQ